MRLPRLIPRARAIAAACPPCAPPLAGILVQGAPLLHPKSVTRVGADAATGPPYLRSSNLLLEALMRLPKLVPGAASSAAACPSFAHPLAGLFVQGARPHCALLNQSLELELMLVLALLTFAPATCY